MIHISSLIFALVLLLVIGHESSLAFTNPSSKGRLTGRGVRSQKVAPLLAERRRGEEGVTQGDSLGFGALALVAFTRPACANTENKSWILGYKLQKSEDEGKAESSPVQYDILRCGSGTEPPVFSILEKENALQCICPTDCHFWKMDGMEVSFMRLSFLRLVSFLLRTVQSFHFLRVLHTGALRQRCLALGSGVDDSEGKPNTSRKGNLKKSSAEKKGNSNKKNELVEKEMVKPKKTKKSKTTTPTNEPQHWTNSSDLFSVVVLSRDEYVTCNNYTAVLDLYQSKEEGSIASLAMTIRGHPLPLRRHRTSRGFMYNPSAKAQASFRKETSMLVFGVDVDDKEEKSLPVDSSGSVPPLFPADTFLSVTLILRLRRPLSHFRSSKRESCILKASAPTSLTSVLRTDVDNLAKFVLDACNGLLYEDDRQIQSLHVIKQLDNEGQCLGSTHLFIKAIDDSMEQDILQHAIQPYNCPSYLGLKKFSS